MKHHPRRSSLAFVATFLLLTASVRAQSEDSARLATGDDPAKSAAAIKSLRDLGPAGLDALLKANAAAITAHNADPAAKDPAWCRIASAIDAVAKQKDAWASGLYWYTDLDQAKAAARAAKKPILSLRLLGTLDTEFSCANSRFFRTALYANQDLSKYLRENFVLHWKSVRPVPKVTIDFGDGRVVERTITGNSIHYVLDADGNVIDGIPGLYGPEAFYKQLDIDLLLARKLTDSDPRERDRMLAAFHKDQAATLLRAWETDLQAVGGRPSAASSVFSPSASGPTPVAALTARWDPNQPLIQFADSRGLPSQSTAMPPTALQARGTAVSKGIPESKLVRQFSALPPPLPAEPLTGVMSINPPAAPILAIASPAPLPGTVTTLPSGVMSTVMPTAAEAAPRAMSKYMGESSLVRQLTVNGGVIQVPQIPPVPAGSFSNVPVVTNFVSIARSSTPQELETATTEDLWQKIADRHAADSKLDTGSRAMIVSKNPTALVAGARADSKRKTEDPLVKIVRNFEHSMAMDTVRNEYLYHRAIHEWLAQSRPAIDPLNERVYAELFLTPSSDPWLGLLPADAYSALENEGVKK